MREVDQLCRDHWLRWRLWSEKSRNVDAQSGHANVKSMGRQRAWMTTEQAASEAGMTAEWVRHQIVRGRLAATVWDFGGRRTYRIRADDWQQFLARYSSRTDDPEWE